jgi:hypothetical protein
MAVVGIKAKEIVIGSAPIRHLEIYYFMPNENIGYVYTLDENSDNVISGYIRSGILYIFIYNNQKHVETHIHKGYSKLELAIKHSN